jgi:NitT/TauT family transport system substrate-binding protein
MPVRLPWLRAIPATAARRSRWCFISAALGLALLAGSATARADAAIRIGSLRYGTLAWELDVIARHGLDRAHGLRIETVELAGTPAAQLALQAERVDLIVSDWLWVSRQRAGGADLTFIPYSTAVGAVMVPASSPIRDIAGLAGRRLGIAGSALDKSWLILQLYARARFGFDLAARVDKSFGAPPLLSEQLMAGRLDAVLTYWPFAAKLEGRGMRPLLSIGDALAALGIAPDTPITGYVLSAGWAAGNGPALDAFLAASREARAILDASDTEWERIAPLTGAADATELVMLRQAYRQGIPRRWTAEQQGSAARLYALLFEIGGAAALGPSREIVSGTFFDAVRF